MQCRQAQLARKVVKIYVKATVCRNAEDGQQDRANLNSNNL